MTWPEILVAGWETLDERFAWVRALRACPQDSTWHAEGSVWIHTRMVLEALELLPSYQTLDPDEQHIVYTAALLHDVAKPECTKTEDDGRITSRGHSGRGEKTARALLWEMNAPLRAREQIAALVRFHQLPFFADKPDAAKRIDVVSQLVSPKLLSIVTEADARGRKCENLTRLLDNIELFRLIAEERGCYERPRELADAHTRFEYFRSENRDASYTAHDETRCEMTLMSGLPAAGKDHWLSANAGARPVISLDGIRKELGVHPDDNQGVVVNLARDRARGFLREQRDFVWNATNLSRRIRAGIIGLGIDYRARICIEYREVDAVTQRIRNGKRARPVPPAIVEKMIRSWEVPDITEAHRVHWNDEAAGWFSRG